MADATHTESISHPEVINFHNSAESRAPHIPTKLDSTCNVHVINNPQVNPYQNMTHEGDDHSSHSEDYQQPQVKPYKLVSQCFAEFLATCLFIYLGTVQSGLTLNAPTYVKVIVSAFVHGAAITALGATFGFISGAQMNPAVTIAISTMGYVPPIHAACFMISQFAGGILGSSLSWPVLSGVNGSETRMMVAAVGEGFEWYHALIAEAVATFMLVTVVFLLAVDSYPASIQAASAIGLTIFVNILATGNVSGGAINPIRALCPVLVGAVMDTSQASELFNRQWVYEVGELFGAMLAVGVYKLMLASSKRIVP